MNISTVSYEGYLDIVPFLPPTDLFINLLKEHSRKRPEQRQQQQQKTEDESKPPNVSKILLEILNLERWYERGNMVPSTKTTTTVGNGSSDENCKILLGPQRRCYIDDKYQIFTLIDDDVDGVSCDDVTSKIGRKLKNSSIVDMERMLQIANILKQGLTVAKNSFVAAHSLQPYTEVKGEEGNGIIDYGGISPENARFTTNGNNSALVTSFGTYASILQHNKI